MVRLLVPLLFLLMACPVLAQSPIRSIDGFVMKVSDGDTITVNADGSKVKVRLYGIDAPETEKSNKKTGRVSKPGQPFGEEAFMALQSKVGGKRVRLDVMDVDRYKRAVCVVWVDGREINREMVLEGLAWAYKQYLDRPHASEYLRAEEQARSERRGLWKQYNPVPPWEFRRGFR
jgi:micrococcal nuclease